MAKFLPDAAGICCSPLDCGGGGGGGSEEQENQGEECGWGKARAYDANGCRTCACEAVYCGGKVMPLGGPYNPTLCNTTTYVRTTATTTTTTTTTGSDSASSGGTMACPANSFCHSDAEAGFSVCCPGKEEDVLGSKTTPTPLPLPAALAEDGEKNDKELGSGSDESLDQGSSSSRTTTTTATTSEKARTTAAQSTRLVGGKNSVSVDDTGVLDAASCAISGLNMELNGAFQLQLLDISSASRQVVSGLLYELQLRAAESSACPNDGGKKERKTLSCPIDYPARTFRVSVIVQPWRNVCDLSDFTELVGVKVEGDGSGGSQPQASSSSSTTFTCVESERVAYCRRANGATAPPTSLNTGATIVDGLVQTVQKEIGDSGNNSNSNSNSSRSSSNSSNSSGPSSPSSTLAKDRYCCQYYANLDFRAQWFVWIVVIAVIGTICVVVSAVFLIRRRRRRYNSNRYAAINSNSNSSNNSGTAYYITGNKRSDSSCGFSRSGGGGGGVGGSKSLSTLHVPKQEEEEEVGEGGEGGGEEQPSLPPPLYTATAFSNPTFQLRQDQQQTDVEC